MVDVQTQEAIEPPGQQAPEEVPPPRLRLQPQEPEDDTQPEAGPREGPHEAFQLPPGLPGARRPMIPALVFSQDTPPQERVRRVEEAYPRPGELPPEPVPPDAAVTKPLTLAELQSLAADNSPIVRRARADVQAAYGAVIQAGLYPNPVLGWQADQWQPGPKPNNNSGQQGAFIAQLLVLPAKLSLAQTVAGFDYVNALVAVRRAEVEVASRVRDAYFALLVSRQAVEVNRLLARSLDEVYRLQLLQVAGGEAAGYEPLQLYAQTVQARNALLRAENAYQAAWQQLASAVGLPELAPANLAGTAEAPAPEFDLAQLRSRVLAQHTDLLAARNTLEQARVNLRLQRIMPLPNLETYFNVGHDNSNGNDQFQLQLGVPVPVFNRNQGNIRQAQAQVARATADLRAVENELLRQLAEAYARYRSSTQVAAHYRDEIIPSLTQAYQAIVRRYQVEPQAVGFNEIVVAQQNLSTALHDYLAALDAQWQAVVDLANLGQLDELYLGVGEGP
jgi:cobalt-zinc-cadmium efflux system outer membrane protein